MVYSALLPYSLYFLSWLLLKSYSYYFVFYSFLFPFFLPLMTKKEKFIPHCSSVLCTFSPGFSSTHTAILSFIMAFFSHFFSLKTISKHIRQVNSASPLFVHLYLIFLLLLKQLWLFPCDHSFFNHVFPIFLYLSFLYKITNTITEAYALSHSPSSPFTCSPIHSSMHTSIRRICFITRTDFIDATKQEKPTRTDPNIINSLFTEITSSLN